MRIYSLFGLIFTFIFFVQSSAWATGQRTLQYKAALNELVTKINSYSKSERKEKFEEFLKIMPLSDQLAIKKYVSNLDKVNLPKLVVKGEAITFEMMGKNIAMEFLDEGPVKINGKKYDFAFGKFATEFEKLEKDLARPTVSFLDFFISNAHAVNTGETVSTIVGGVGAFLVVVAMVAGFELLLLGGLIVMVGGTFGMFVSRGIEYYGTRQVKKYCSSIKDKLSEVKSESNKSELDKILSAVRNSKSKLKADSRCDNESRKEACADASECLDSLENEITATLNHVNQSDRVLVKDADESRSRKRDDAKGATKQ